MSNIIVDPPCQRCGSMEHGSVLQRDGAYFCVLPRGEILSPQKPKPSPKPGSTGSPPKPIREVKQFTVAGIKKAEVDRSDGEFFFEVLEPPTQKVGFSALLLMHNRGSFTG